ncbi:MAG: GDSL-type esterase/lipase family protein [Sterolibacteriaceae bacterium MAG5]|nr:GDSL-type esterase/lipase family protein [Candidatus Nitricoxidireducens bremensis]
MDKKPAPAAESLQPVPNWLLNLALVVLSLLFAVGIAEIVGRYVYPVRTITKVLDRELLFAPVPESRKIFHRDPANGKETVWMRFNSHGHRGPDRPLMSGSRIVVYGDSFIEAEYSKEENTFSGRLEKDLATAFGRDFQVINAGVSGYGPDQALKRIERDLPATKPDFLLLSIYTGNDYGDLLRNKLFLRTPDGSLADHQPKISEALVAEFADAEKKSKRLKTRAIVAELKQILRSAFSNKPPQGQAVANSIDEWKRWLGQREAEYVQLAKEGDRTVHNLFNDGFDADIATEPSSPSARYKAELMRDFLRLAKLRLAKSGVPFAVMVVPAPMDACENYDWSADRAAFPFYDRHALTRIATEAARDAGISVINLFDVLATKDCNTYFFHYGDAHWSDRGQAVAAAEVASALKRFGGAPFR